MLFDKKELKKLYRPDKNTSGEDNGQVTIIGGSSLFQGAPLLSLTAASRVVDMVFFASPHEPMKEISAYMKANLHAFIWIPWHEVDEYVAKSDSVLIGPGFMRSRSEKANHSEACDEECEKTKNITKRLLMKFPEKKWVIDAGSLQVMEPEWIPENAIITPNKKEFKMLFRDIEPSQASMKFKCFIVLKGPVTHVYTPLGDDIEVHGGNPGMTKGGSGDTMAGLTAALLAKNDPRLAATSGAFVIKAAGDDLYKYQSVYFNADDLASQIPHTLALLTN